MADTTETIRSEALKYVTGGVLGAISLLLLGLGKEVLEVLPAFQSQPLLDLWHRVQNTLLLLLALVSGLLIWLMLHYRKKSLVLPPSGGYEFAPDPGYYVHKKNGGHFCNPCLANGFASRLSIHHIDGLKCRLCGEVYIDPKSQHAAFAEYAKQYSGQPQNSI